MCVCVCVCLMLVVLERQRSLDLERLLSASHNTQPPTHQGTTTPATRPGQPHTTHQQALLRTTLCIITSRIHTQEKDIGCPSLESQGWWVKDLLWHAPTQPMTQLSCNNPYLYTFNYSAIIYLCLRLLLVLYAN